MCELQFNRRVIMVLCILYLVLGFLFNFVFMGGCESEHGVRYLFLNISTLGNIKEVAFHFPSTN